MNTIINTSILHGRYKDHEECINLLFGNKSKVSTTNILCIAGESGMGKTTLANIIFKSVPERENNLNKNNIKDLSAYKKYWVNIISDLAHHFLRNEFPPNISSEELEQKLLSFIKENKVFIFIDNIDDNLEEYFIKFINKWDESKGAKLLFTAKSEKIVKSLPAKCKVHQLKGLTEQSAIKNLLGDDLFEYFIKHKKMELLDELNNNPQKLIYLNLQWQFFNKNIYKLRELIDDLNKDNILVEPMLTAEYPLEHFLALGRIRLLKFDEELLAFLWDKLVRNNTELYIRTLNWLLEKKLLLIIDDQGKFKFRLSANVHINLGRPLEAKFGKEHIAPIDYFISEYYRNLFSRHNNKDSFEFQFLEFYIDHALYSNYFDSAYSYVFESDIINKIHCHALSLDFKRILNNFNDYFDKNFWKNNPEDCGPRRAEQGATIKIELARVSKDLSEYETCKNLMNEANEILDKPGGKEIRKTTKRELKRKIWHYLGVAYSQLGDTNACLEYYFRLIKEAADYKEDKKNKFTYIDALSLGYLAYELKFYDINFSEIVAKKALALSEKMSDQNIIIKNLCNLAQIQAFKGNAKESIKNSNLSYAKCKYSQDIRTLGRILVNSSVAYIQSSNLVEAEKKITEALKLYKGKQNNQNGINEISDIRREFMGRAYQAIINYKKGKHEKAKKETLEAFENHRKIAAKREMIYELLSYIWMLYPKSEKGIESNAIEALSAYDLTPEAKISLREIFVSKKDELQIFVDFWKNHYMPILLKS